MTILSERRTYVDGAWVTGEQVIPVENPADESHVADVLATPIAEVERAVLAARRSFDADVWAGRSPQERARVLHRFVDHIEEQRETLVDTLVAEAGQPIRFADETQCRAGVAIARQTIDLYLAMPHEESNPVPVDDLVRGRVALSIRRHEGVGVVTAITPYNASLIMALQKLIPALMAGNSVILRPSPLTPISSLVFGHAAEAAGLPAGVLSVVAEEGMEGAKLLTTHPAVDMVSFTGSTAAGRAIIEQAAPTVKRLSLELGGKSAQIYLPDALGRVGLGALAVVARTAGQACVAATRMLVPEESKEDVLQAVASAYASVTVGAPTDPAALMGPVISAPQRAKCEQFVALAEQNGAKVRFGGGRPDGLERGYYFEPTVLDLPSNANPAAQEEIFGPVVGVIGYRDLDEAVAIANDSVYGLSSQVHSADTTAALGVARRLRAGAVNVNTTVFSAYAPSGGYKQSGLGRERGPDGIREFQEVKHISIGELPK